MAHTVSITTDGSVRGSDSRVWEEHGRRMVDVLLTEARLPSSINWKVQARLSKHARGQRPPYALKGMDKSIRRIEVAISPQNNLTFDVAFSFSSDDIGWESACQQIEVAINRLRLPARVARETARRTAELAEQKSATFTEDHLRRLRDGLDALLKVTDESKAARVRLEAEVKKRDELRAQHDKHMEVVLKAKADVDAEIENFTSYQAEHTRRLGQLRDVFAIQNSTLAQIEDDLALAGLEIESIECTLSQGEQMLGTSPEVIALLKGLAGSSPTS